MKRIIGISLAAMLAACSGQDSAERDQGNDAALDAQAALEAANAAALDAATVPKPEVAEAAAMASVASLTDSQKGKVCRAAIANVMGRDPSIIRVLSQTGGITRVRYTRDDGTVWTNECRVNADNVDWRAVDGGQPGRWRSEDTIRYKIEGSRITIQQFMSGEHIDTQTYTVS